jgi:PTH1 family peptidyl-tRNA hydrolase
MSSHGYKLILGLGNPGEEYARTYHNAGALAVAHYIEEMGGKLTRPKGKHFSSAKMDGCMLVIPTTFMNESGIAVREALAFFKLKPDELCVIHDDSDIELGNYKVSVGRGSAGHHGIESIIASLGSNAFARVRVGIRPTPTMSAITRKKAGEFVLSRISKKDLLEFYRVFGAIKVNVIEKETPSSRTITSVSGKLTS